MNGMDREMAQIQQRSDALWAAAGPQPVPTSNADVFASLVTHGRALPNPGYTNAPIFGPVARPLGQSVVQAPPSYARRGSEATYAGMIAGSARECGIDPHLVAAIIENESGFNANATSGCGAQGLMQLMPGTAAGLGVSNAYDPAQNIAGGSKYIAGQLRRYGYFAASATDETRRGAMIKAIAAYNAGPGNVEKYGGVPPFAETQRYVRNVMAAYERRAAAPAPPAT